MHDLGDLRQRPHCPRADAGHEQEFGEVRRTAFGRGGETGVQTPGDDVLALARRGGRA